MRLCWITHVPFYERDGRYFGSDGYMRFVRNLGALFDHVEMCVPVSSDSVPQKGYSVVSEPNVTISPLPVYAKRWEQVALLKLPLLAPGLLRSISRCDMTWIFLPNYVSIWAWLTCLLLGKPFLLGIVGDWGEVYRLAFNRRGIPVLGGLVGGLHNLVLAAMIRTSRFTFTVGSSLARKLGKGNSRVSYYINSRFQEEDLADRVSGGSGSQRRLLAVGRLDHYKGVIELLRAARALTDEGFDVRVRLAGEGNERESLERAAKEMGISDRVDFMGWVPLFPDLQEEFRSADAFVLSSYTEGFPKVVLEAMCNGTPVVSTRVGSLPDVVMDAHNGLLVEPRSARALTGAIRRLLADEDLRQSIGSRGLATAGKYTMKQQRACVEDALRGAGMQVGGDGRDSSPKCQVLHALGVKTLERLGFRKRVSGREM